MRRTPLDRPPSLAARVVEHLRKGILEAEFKLGEALSEDKIAAMLGVSRTPVREALTALQLQGLINIVPQRGSFVFLPSETDIAELCEFRMMMESRAILLCHARRREETLARLIEANRAFHEADRAKDYIATARADAAFHEALFENCENHYLAEAYRPISGRISALRSHMLHLQLKVRNDSKAEHDEIIQAFGSGDLLRAEVLLSMHISRMRENYPLALQEGLLGTPPKKEAPRAPSPASASAPA